MPETPRTIDALDIKGPEQFLSEVVGPCRPVLLRGLVKNWPIVEAGRLSPPAVRDYLKPLDAGGEIEAFFGAPAIAGKYFYTEDLKGFNFERRRMKFAAALESIVSSVGAPGSPSIYVGSVPTGEFLPRFAALNPMPLLSPGIPPRVWIGHAANVSSHYDTVDNLACVAAGARRFTLFAPQSIDKLYVGPIDNTMAGQPVSLAASSPADKERFPLFEQIKDQSLVAELEAGDALYLPKLWWHKVESTAPFNALVNYWWDAFSSGPDAPYTSLLLAMITIAERPPAERQAWKAFFDHYVFRSHGHPLAHLPPEQHGLLGSLRENYGKIRARVMHLLRGV
ncbi:MAG TPA: cupin-like domain-containing protein [Steroidobacteraceae bacterium]|nr:cupin-like domain-containing protein [Steroidobacteraceae bacterium]